MAILLQQMPLLLQCAKVDSHLTTDDPVLDAAQMIADAPIAAEELLCPWVMMWTSLPVIPCQRCRSQARHRVCRDRRTGLESEADFQRFDTVIDLDKVICLMKTEWHERASTLSASSCGTHR